MTQAQKQIYDDVLALFGAPYGPRIPLLFSPGVFEPWRALAHALDASRIPSRLRELVILIVARAWDCQFVWYAHEAVARESGVPKALIEAIRMGRRPDEGDPADLAVYNYCVELLHAHRVSDATYAAVRALLGVEQHVELTVMIGHYSNVAMGLIAHDAPLPKGVEPPLPVERDG